VSHSLDQRDALLTTAVLNATGGSGPPIYPADCRVGIRSIVAVAALLAGSPRLTNHPAAETMIYRYRATGGHPGACCGEAGGGFQAGVGRSGPDPV
jgi:hypothetical protein